MTMKMSLKKKIPDVKAMIAKIIATLLSKRMTVNYKLGHKIV